MRCQKNPDRSFKLGCSSATTMIAVRSPNVFGFALVSTRDLKFFQRQIDAISSGRTLFLLVRSNRALKNKSVRGMDVVSYEVHVVQAERRTKEGEGRGFAAKVFARQSNNGSVCPPTPPQHRWRGRTSPRLRRSASLAARGFRRPRGSSRGSCLLFFLGRPVPGELFFVFDRFVPPPRRGACLK